LRSCVKPTAKEASVSGAFTTFRQRTFSIRTWQHLAHLVVLFRLTEWNLYAFFNPIRSRI
jgi:hypothetical protein